MYTVKHTAENPAILSPSLLPHLPGGKQFQGSPPDKGSFPLDHDGECKPMKEQYMACLRATGNDVRTVPH